MHQPKLTGFPIDASCCATASVFTISEVVWSVENTSARKRARRDRPHDQCPPSCRKYVKFSKSRRLTQYGRFRCQPNQTSGRMRNIFPEVISQHAVLLRQLPDTEQRSRQRRQARNDPKTRRNDGDFEGTNPIHGEAMVVLWRPPTPQAR